MQNYYTMDIEVYPNYFLLCVKNGSTGKVTNVEMKNNIPVHKNVRIKVRDLLNDQWTVTFNGRNYDLPLIEMFIHGGNNTQLYTFSKQIIEGNVPTFRLFEEYPQIPFKTYFLKSIDVFKVVPTIASLKSFGARFHTKKLQDLPVDPHKELTEEEMEGLRTYCVNDVTVTEELFGLIKERLNLRVAIYKQYNLKPLQVLNAGDAKLAELIICSKLDYKDNTRERKKIEYVLHKKGMLGRSRIYDYKALFKIKDEGINKIIDQITNYQFQTNNKGALVCPDFLKNKVTLHGKEYTIGIGGLHSNEKKQLVKEDDDYMIISYDVVSYYPSLMVEHCIHPKSFKIDFVDLLKKIIDDRVKAKNNGDSTTNAVMKIVLNGTFGKLSDKYSVFYDPQSLLSVTITGQLYLLKLIEMLSKHGEVISANTDGVVVKCLRDKQFDVDNEAIKWQTDTDLELERETFSMVASRDVNTYFAQYTNGDIKTKGKFAEDGFNKTPDKAICYDAVIRFLTQSTPIKNYIEVRANMGDIRPFLKSTKVTGGAICNGKLLGKNVRFYYSTDPEYKDGYIGYAETITKDGNYKKVSDSEGAKPCQDLPEKGIHRDEIDIDKYIKIANKILKDVGYNNA